MPKKTRKPGRAKTEESPLREISKVKLAEILAQHRKWVESEKKEGKSADLSNANLQGANLAMANLQGADLSETKLSKAQLLRAKLAEADLRDATLTGATGVQAWQFAGADLSGATFGESSLGFEQPLRVVEEASKNARKIFVSVLVGCAYSLLTLATTSGAGGNGNNSIALPILQTSVPTVWFYWGAPVVLLSMFVYFHLYLQNLWEALAELPAVFPDGRTADKKVYPWLLNGLVRFHFKLLRRKPPRLAFLKRLIPSLLVWGAMSRLLALLTQQPIADRYKPPRLAFLKRLIPSLLAWWAVPITLLVFLAQQSFADRWGWGWQLVLASGSLGLAGYFQFLTRRTLRQEDAALKLWPRFHRLKNLSWLKKLSWPKTLNWIKNLIRKRRPSAAG